MATGLMTLAYMAEMAIVFNVAYSELSRGRYIAQPREALEKLRSDIKEADPGPTDPNEWTKATTKLTDRLDKMLSTIARHRQDSWYITSDVADGDDQSSWHFNFWAGPVFAFFQRGDDKELCHHAMVLCAIVLGLMTILDHGAGVEEHPLRNAALWGSVLMLLAAVLWFMRFLFGKIRVWIPVAILAAGALGCTSWAESVEVATTTSSLTTWWYLFWIYVMSIVPPAACVVLGRKTRTQLFRCIDDVSREFEHLKAQPLEAAENAGPRPPAR